MEVAAAAGVGFSMLDAPPGGGQRVTKLVRFTVVLAGSDRARGGVGHTPGITVIRAPGAAAAAVMPGVSRTPGLPRGGDVPG